MTRAYQARCFTPGCFPTTWKKGPVAPTGGARQRTQPSLSSARPLTVGKQAGETKEAIKIKIQLSCLSILPAPELWVPAVCPRRGCVSPEGTSPGTAGCADSPVQGNTCRQAQPAAALPALTAHGCFPFHQKALISPTLGRKAPGQSPPAPSRGARQCLGLWPVALGTRKARHLPACSSLSSRSFSCLCLWPGGNVCQGQVPLCGRQSRSCGQAGRHRWPLPKESTGMKGHCASPCPPALSWHDRASYILPKVSHRAD